MTQSVSWIITLFPNVTEENWETIHASLWDSGKLKYLGSQLERCPGTGRLHWQAFAKFTSKHRKAGVLKILPDASWTSVTVERAEAIGYGIKSDSRVAGPKEDGVKPRAVDRHAVGGQRTKEQWDEVKKMIVLGDKNAIPVDLILKYNLDSRFNKLQKFWSEDPRIPILPPWLPNPWGLVLPTFRTSKKRHYWLWSEKPNLGKTYHFALPLQKSYRSYIKSGDFTYWDVSADIQLIIIDDYNYAGLPYHKMNLLCDGTYEFRIIHQGLLKLDRYMVVVLSNQCLRDVYPFKYELLEERFHTIKLD